MDGEHDESLRNEFLLQQYVKLREEITGRTGIQQQFVTISLLGAGATLTIGANSSLQFGIPVLLLYPLLVMFLAIAWSTQYATIRDMGAFIARLEGQVFLHGDARTLGWESVLRRGEYQALLQRAFLTGWQDAKGIFLGIEILSLALAVGRSGIHVAAIQQFLEHPEVVRPYLWLLALGCLDIIAVGVTLALPEAHPAMRRSVFRLVPSQNTQEVRHESRPQET